MSISIGNMRRIDYFFGVPLCFVGTIIRSVWSYFFPLKQRDECRKVLFISLSETGSTILADPAMSKVKSILDADVYFVIFKRNLPVLDLLGSVPADHIFTIRDSKITLLVYDSLRFFVWAREKQIDTVIDLELFSRFTALLAGFSGACRTVGFHTFYSEGLFRGDFFTHKVLYNSHHHISKNFIALVNALLSEKQEIPFSKSIIPDDEPVLRKITVEDQSKISMRIKIAEVCISYDEKLHKIVLFNTNASDLIPLRRWPKENYISLARTLIEQYSDIIILLTGVDAERLWNDEIVTAVNSDRCINFAGCTSFAELPVLYSVSGLMLTNDSGPAHFASLTQLPIFVFFGPETPSLYRPLGNATIIYSSLACSPCVSAANHRRSPCNDNVCLQMITPEMVMQYLMPQLESVTDAAAA